MSRSRAAPWLLTLLLSGLSLRAEAKPATVEDDALRRLDAALLADWRAKGLTAAPDAPDADDLTFLRRLSFDLYGRPPRIEELRAFEKDASPVKRAKKVKEALKSREFADAWAWLFVDTLRGSATTQQGVNEEVFWSWRSDALQRGLPYDQTVKALITARGRSDNDGPSNFIVMHAADPMALTSTTGKVFLGLEISCAQCHDHPMEKWTQRQFYGLAAHYARLKQKREKGPPPVFTVVEQKKGEVKLGDGPQAQVVDPAVLDFGPKVEELNGRREALADWVASAENPMFATAYVDRVWRLFNQSGSGGVALPEAGRRALAEAFVRSGFDERAVLSVILQSRAYALSSASSFASVPVAGFAAPDPATLVRAPVRALTGRQIVATLTALNEGDASFDGLDEAQAKKRRNQLKLFQKAFSDDAALADPEGFKPSVPQVLLLRNGGMTGAVLRQKSALMEHLRDVKQGGASRAELLDELCLALVGRHPLPDESDAFAEELSGRKEKNAQPVLQDAAWALINSSDFLFNR